MKYALLVVVSMASMVTTGCGPAQTVMPSGQFTEEQKIAAAAEYQKVEDEESMGNNKKFKKSAKR